MRAIIIITLSFMCITYCYSQEIDSYAFRKVSKEYLVKYISIKEKMNYHWKNIELADTNNIKFHLPILMLKEIENDPWNYIALSPYIEKKFSPHNQFAFIKNKDDVQTLTIKKEIYDKKVFLSKIRNTFPPDSTTNIVGLTGENPHFGDFFFPDEDIKIDFEKILEYNQNNPCTILFMIYKLPGIWGMKNNQLIKLRYIRNKYEDLDGEKYYREHLFPLSPRGIKRVIEEESFLIVMVK